LPRCPRSPPSTSRWYPSRWIGLRGWFGFGAYGKLGKHLRFVERASRRLAREAFHGMIVYGPGLERRQGFLFRWVDIAMELFAMSASVSRAHALRKLGGPAGANAETLADTFCQGAALKVETLFRGLWRNNDAANVALSKSVLDGDYQWVESGIITLDEADAARARRASRKASEGATVNALNN
jgi:hypothetical protein